MLKKIIKWEVMILFLLFMFSVTFVNAENNDKIIYENEIYFHADSDMIKNDSNADLEEIINILKNNPDLLIELSGHTNSIGEPKNELDLSVKRADKISDYLINNGIDQSRIKKAGYGSTLLKINSIDNINRRVEVAIISKEIETIKVNPESTEETRKLKITVTDVLNKNISAMIEIKKRENDEIIFSNSIIIKKPTYIEIPNSEVEILATSDGYVPKKVYSAQGEIDKHIYLDKIEKGKGFVVDSIYFDPNRSNLKPESYDIIDNIIDIMKKDPKIKLEIRGHTDTNMPGNKQLSEDRAKAVLAYMVKKGISEDRLIAAGYGGTQPIAPRGTEAGRRKNRRTEFYFLD